VSALEQSLFVFVTLSGMDAVPVINPYELILENCSPEFVPVVPSSGRGCSLPWSLFGYMLCQNFLNVVLVLSNPSVVSQKVCVTSTVFSAVGQIPWLQNLKIYNKLSLSLEQLPPDTQQYELPLSDFLGISHIHEVVWQLLIISRGLYLLWLKI